MSDNNIISMSNKRNDGMLLTPRQALKEAYDDTADGQPLEDTKKILILMLNDADNSYDVSFMQSGMNMTGCVTLCDISKTIFKSVMGFYE